MTMTLRRVTLALLSIFMVSSLAYVLTHREILGDPIVPETFRGKARWLAEHPSDALAASELADVALDTTLPRRHQLWVAAYDQAMLLSPLRPNARAGFVRAGLFHWTELEAPERAKVLDVAAPLMKENERFFGKMSGPIYTLTRDFGYLRRVAPDALGSMWMLQDIAVTRGLFAEYRALRDPARERTIKEIRRRSEAGDPASDWIQLLPRQFDMSDAPLVAEVLRLIDLRPSAAAHLEGRADVLIAFALRHHIQPLDALEPLLERNDAISDPLAARLALALGHEDLATRIASTSANINDADWIAFHLDAAQAAARRGNARAANTHLERAELAGDRLEVHAARLALAKMTGDRVDPSALANEKPVWRELCDPGNLCRFATAAVFATSARLFPIHLEVAQSDELHPYVEVFIDDVRVTEGDVAGERTFEITVPPGLHEVRVRLVNPRTRNGTQRLLRLS